MSTDYKYRAFISYSHKDEKWAAWLHRALETYKVPKHLVGKATNYGPVPERIAPIFRDREELATSTELGDVLTEALQQSACLIVICSPNAALSRWTNEEILTYKRLGRQDRIFCLIVDGEPNASMFEETAEFECFPEGLMFQMGPDGKLTARRSEPIAADARPGKDNKQNAKLKLIAGMIGVGFDDLKQREQQRRQKRMYIITAAAIVGMVVTSGLATLAVLARNEADVQRRQAEIEAETARQTTDFMVGLFAVSDPSEARGNTITAREIMDKGASRIESELAGQPETQARLLDTMGTVYTSLGLYDQATSLLDRSLQIRRQAGDEINLESADTKNRLGEVLSLKADYETAEALYRDALVVRRELLGNEHVLVADSLRGLAYVLSMRGEYTTAEPLLREALATRRQLLGLKNPEVAQILEELGLNLFDQGDYDGAEPLLRESVDMRRDIFGEDPHPDLAEGINNLGLLLWSNGSYLEAESLFREAVDMKRELFGDTHPELAIGFNNLALVLHDQKKYAEAETMYKQVIAMQRQLLGDGHPEVAQGLNNLSFLLFDLGQSEAAIAMARQSLDIYRRALGDEHPEVARVLGNLGGWLSRQGDYITAEPLLNDSLAMSRKLLGDQHPRVAVNLTALADLLVATGRFEEGRKVAKQAKVIFSDTMSEDHWRTRVAASIEGASLVGLEQFEAAEALLLPSYDVLVADAGVLEVYKSDVLGHLVRLYSAWGKPDQAVRYQDLLDKFASR